AAGRRLPHAFASRLHLGRALAGGRGSGARGLRTRVGSDRSNRKGGRALTYVGQPVPSLTNTKLVAGRGRFVDDIQLPGMTYAAVLRSPFAHARIRSIDASRAEALLGVLHVLTGREVAEQMNPIPETYDTAAVGAKGVRWYALCVDRA